MSFGCVHASDTESACGARAAKWVVQEPNPFGLERGADIVAERILQLVGDEPERDEAADDNARGKDSEEGRHLREDCDDDRRRDDE